MILPTKLYGKNMHCRTVAVHILRTKFNSFSYDSQCIFIIIIFCISIVSEINEEIRYKTKCFISFSSHSKKKIQRKYIVFYIAATFNNEAFSILVPNHSENCVVIYTAIRLIASHKERL